MKKLPFRAVTATGDKFDLEFPLHPDTEEVVRVEQLLTAVLEAVDAHLKLAGDGSNGDVLQAMAMAMAVRARIINAPFEQIEALASDLFVEAMQAVAAADRHSPPAGRA